MLQTLSGIIYQFTIVFTDWNETEKFACGEALFTVAMYVQALAFISHYICLVNSNKL
jgi:hypothetical protein